MNVLDKFKGWSVEQIRLDVQRDALPYSILMQHIDGDFNISTVIRNANAFAATEVLYFGKKKWDRRGAVGTHNYTQLTHIDDIDAIRELSTQRRLVALENNVEGVILLDDFEPQRNDIFVLGEESTGVTEDILKLCSCVVSIPQLGSVRSLNVGTASGILMYDVSKKLKKTIGAK